MDACIHSHRLVDYIKSQDVKAGVVLNPATPVNTLEEIIHFVDYVLVMSVNPGFGGQRFIPETLHKVRKLKLLMEEVGRTDLLIEIDGGIKEDNIREVSLAGVNIFVAGSSVFKAEDPAEAVRRLKEKAVFTEV